MNHCSRLTNLVAADLERPSVDNRQYRVITLPNKLEALLIHDPECDRGSAALDVNVGSFADPQDLPGLAHFCEHLLFMGTEKYPGENDYNYYLSEHSGSSNAYTATDETNYFFDVSHEYLEGALDRFAQFFISPLFLRECRDREIRAVDSENKKNLQSDTWRLHQLDRSLSNPSHPYNQFSTGNLQTLETEPKKRGQDVRQELLKFHANHYSANLMKLVVLGRESLDTLEQWVSEKFTAVKNIDLPVPSYDSVPFTSKQLQKMIFAKPVMDSKHVTLFFPVPDQRKFIDSKPSSYYSHLIGHEGKGSLLQYLKSKSLASGLSAGSEHIADDCDVFVIDVELTEQGLKQYEQVFEDTFAYLKLLQQTSSQEWIFEELKVQAEMKFKFQQKAGSINTTSRLASIMQRNEIPRNNLLSHHLLREYDAKAIEDFATYLTPDNSRLFIVGQELEGCNEQEKWYGTEYAYKDIEPKLFNRLNNVVVPEILHLPPKNEFIPTDFDVQKKEIAPEDRLQWPRLIRKTDQQLVWHKKDDTFWIPKADVHINLKTPIAQSTPGNAVNTSLLTALVNDALVEYAYDAEIAGLRYEVALVKGGLGIHVGGFNHKLPVLLEKVLEKLKNFKIDLERFNVMKERHQRFYRNFGYNVPYSQIASFSHYLLNDTVWQIDEKAKELETTQPEDLERLLPELLRNLQIEMLAIGNVTKERALDVADLTMKVLDPKQLSMGQRIPPRSYYLNKDSSRYYKIPLGDAKNVNSAIEYIVQWGKLTDRDLKARLDLFAQIASEPAFNQLRTKEQLGYVVFGGVRTTRTTMGYRVLVQSERSTEYLEERIDCFFNKLIETIEQMTEEEFENHKQSLVSKKRERMKNLREESDRYWNQIQSGFYDFMQREDDAVRVLEVEKGQVVELAKKFVSPDSKERAKLVVHLQSQCTPDLSIEAVISSSVVNLATRQNIELEASDIEQLCESIESKDVDEMLKLVKTKLVEEKEVKGEVVDKLLERAKTDIQSRLAEESTGYPDGEEIENVAMFKSGMGLTEAPTPRHDLSAYMESEPKL